MVCGILYLMNSFEVSLKNKNFFLNEGFQQCRWEAILFYFKSMNRIFDVSDGHQSVFPFPACLL